MIKSIIFLTFLLIATGFLFSNSNAQLYLNDTFDRATITPWMCYGGFGGCSPTCSIESSTMKLTQAANCTAGAAFSTYIDSFYWQFDYTHLPNNLIIAEWTDGSYTDSIRFDTSSNLIYFSTSSIFSDVATSSYPFTNNVFYTTPYTFGFSSGTTHTFNITKANQTVDIYIDSSFVTEVININIRARMYNIAFGQYNAGASHSHFDNVIVYSTGTTKITPILRFFVSPSFTVSEGTSVTVQCYASYPDIPLNLYWGNTLEPNPFIYVLPLGNNAFICVSNETAIYNSVTVSDVVTVIPTTTATVATTPISAVNTTEWSSMGYGWALFLFSPIFITTVIVGAVSAVSARVGGVAVGGSVAILLVLVMTIAQIYPIWVGIVFIIIAGFILMSIFRQATTK
jgi:hypothetical protein